MRCSASSRRSPAWIRRGRKPGSRRPRPRPVCTRCTRGRLADSQRTMLQASAVLAQAYLDKEASQGCVAEMVAQRDQKRQERARLAQQAQTVRTEWRKHQENVHQRELESANLRHQLD